jgi:ACR3 family arsenite transporter
MNTATTLPTQAAPAPMSVFERYLSVWVALCIVAGIALGQLLPGPFQAIGRMEVAQVNLPVGLLIWVMIIPMLLKVDFGALHQVKAALARHRRHAVRELGGQAVLDGAAGLVLRAPGSPLAAGRAARQLHRRPDPAGRGALHGHGVRLEPADQRRPAVHARQVALNDTIMVFAFAPIVALLLGLSAITVPWDTLLTSVVLYIVIPVILAQLWRKALLRRGQAAFDAALAKIGPWSITALLATLVLLFAFQGRAILQQPLVIACWRCPS